MVFLDLPVDVAGGREGFGGERYEQSGLQEMVRACFEVVRKREGGEKGDGWWTVVDAGRAIEEVAESVATVAEKAVTWAKQNELQRIE